MSRSAFRYLVIVALCSPLTVLADTAYVPGNFMISDRVEVQTGPLRQHALPDVATSTDRILGKQKTGAMGTVTNGPVMAAGRVWWFIDFFKGPDGWSAQDYLALVSPPQQNSAQIDALQKQLLVLLAQINSLK